jgi:hypothetical protein
MHVVNRLILGLLGYTGPHVDCRTWTVVSPNVAAPIRNKARAQDGSTVT